jgi:type II secretory ATPase GspE/PulE/Tfp pilus assembly ATPase PilB-like protein
VSAVTRLIDMGVEPFLVSSVLEGVLAQRLGRRICPHCRREGPIPEALTHRLSQSELAMFGGTCFEGAGCEKCNDSGYKGRIGYFEVLEINGPMRRAISQRQSGLEILGEANATHLRMRTDGLIKAADGRTTIDEVLRATQDAEEELRMTAPAQAT